MPNIPTITAPTRSTLRRPSTDLLRLAGFALAVLGLELALAHGVVGPEISRYVLLFVALFGIALFFRFPLATALLLLALTDFIFPADMFSRNVGSLSVRPHEVALVCLLLLALVRPRRDDWGGRAGASLAVFLALVAVSAGLAIEAGHTSFSEAFNTARPLAPLAFFFVVIRLFPDPEERRLLLNVTAILAAITGVVAAVIAFGALGGGALAVGEETIRTQEGLGSLERVRLAGLSAGYAVFWFCVVKTTAATKGVSRAIWFLILAGIGLDILVSFNRNMWLGLTIGAILMAFLAGRLVRRRMALGVALAVVGLAVATIVGSSASQDQLVQPILKRGETILNPTKTSQENSLADRKHETSEAWGVAKQHLVIGVGAGVPFDVYKEEQVTSGNIVFGNVVTPQLFLHNQYLYLILISGIPGLIAFLLFLGFPVAAALRRVPRDPAITSIGIGIVLIMISSVVAIYFTVPDMTAILGLLTGVIVADRAQGADGEPSRLIV